ncbi:MAG: globin [Solirubrobacterales bacterium]|nr:globin [Solirubrobacterales bacterium]
MTSLYEHAGGDAGLHRLEDLFYSKVLADPLLQPLFGEGQPHHVEHLTWFTAESFGGPDRFTKQLGFDHLVDVHRGLRITDEQRERFVALYVEALDEAGLPADGRSAKRFARTSSSACGSHSRTHGRPRTASSTRSTTFPAGTGREMTERRQPAASVCASPFRRPRVL